MKFICPECEQHLQCDVELSGQVVNCPWCEARMEIPHFEDEGGEAPVEEGGDEQEAAERKRPGGRKQRKQSKLKMRRSSTQPGSKPKPKTGTSTASATQRPATSRKGARQKWSDGTNVSMLGSGAIGLGIGVLYYLFMLPFHRFYLGQLFLERGWVPYILVLLMGWSIGFLILKGQKLASQKNALLLDLLPSSISEEIDVDTVEIFVKHVNALPARLRESFMVNRIRKGLEHFAVRHSNPEVASMLMSQSEIDAGAVHSSYSVVKVFLWAIPILGFIGTVMGISNAVGGFSGALDQAQDIEVLKNSLNEVTSGLAVAFDTTLVALVMSLMVSFPVSMMQKREEDFLGQVDEYCSENLLKRLNDAGGLAEVATHTNAMMQALGNAVAQNQGDLLDGIKAAQERIADSHAEYMANLEESATELMQRMAEPVEEATAEQVENLTTALERLNAVLQALGDRQVVIQQQPRRGLFSWGRKGPR